MYKPFQFKEFSVADDRCIMKTGTDGVLLGVSVRLESPENILDIGAGSGLISLILAQRCNAKIEAVELDKDSAVQAAENFKASPWSDRLTVFHDSIQKFASSGKKKYDLIVCNPPFFSNSLKSSLNKKKNRARHNDELPFDELMSSAKNLLSDNGAFWVIIPDQESFMLESVAIESGMFLIYTLDIFSKEGKAVNRKIMKFSLLEQPKETKTLTIRNSDHSFTTEYMELTKNFYLNF